MYRYRHACMGVGTCAWTCMWRPEVGIPCLPQLLSTLSIEVEYLDWTHTPLIHLVYLASLLWSPCLCLMRRVLEVQVGYYTSLDWQGFWGSRFRSLHLRGKHVTHQTIFLSTPRSLFPLELLAPAFWVAGIVACLWFYYILWCLVSRVGTLIGMGQRLGVHSCHSVPSHLWHSYYENEIPWGIQTPSKSHLKWTADFRWRLERAHVKVIANRQHSSVANTSH